MRERRQLDNLHTGQDSSKLEVKGYAIKFNTPSEVLYTPNGKPFIEIISTNALQETDLTDVRMFAEHDPSKILGRTASNTLKLTVDDIGLFVECELPQTTLGKDTYELIRRGDLTQMSFEFVVNEQGQSWDYSSEVPTRVINSIKSISEVSVVAIPAYTDTELMVAQRSLDKADELRAKELELLKVRIELERWKNT